MLNQIITGLSLERAKAFITEQNGIEAEISFAKMKKFPTEKNGCIITNKSYSISDCEADLYNKVR